VLTQGLSFSSLIIIVKYRHSFIMYSITSYLATIAAILALGSPVLSASSPQVQISAGTLQGGLCESNSTVAYYKSVPYANPPTGGLRYAPPQAYSQKYSNGAL
jgi:hypothetical protein